MWENIKEILKGILGIFFQSDKVYFDWLADKNTKPIFKLKDENESRFGEGIENESSEGAKNED